MTTSSNPRKSGQELDGEDQKQLETGFYSMTVGYSNGESCMVYDEPHAGVTEDSETMVDLSSNDFEIDISPMSGDQDLICKNRELECVVHDLKRENEMLRMKVSDLEEEVSRLKSASESIPLPALYVQLNSVRKQVSDLEKINQDLESENTELVLKLERRDLGEIYTETQESCESGKIPLRRRSPMPRASSSPVCQSVPSKLTKQQTLQTEEWEAAKMDFAEKLGHKEEMIQMLKEQLQASANGLDGLGDGIDALEKRIENQMTLYHSDVSQKFEELLNASTEIQTSESVIEKRATAMQFQISNMIKTYAAEIEQLNRQFQSLQDDKSQELEELELMLENKTQTLEETRNQMESMSDETKRQQEKITELENTIEELEFKISSMKTQRLVPDGLQGAAQSLELDAMRERISQLESSLSEEQKKNEALQKTRADSEETSFSVEDAQQAREMEEMVKENKELKKELLEVSEKLVDMEEQNTSLKDELENHSDFFGQCLSLEEELQANKRINRGLVDHLNRRKKRNENLQKELDIIRQQIGELEGSRGRKRTKEHKAVMSNLMEEMIQHEKRYEELDKILSGVQAERDGLLQEKASLNKMMHSLIKENKVATQALEKLRSEKPAAQERLEDTRKEVTRLKAQLKVESLARRQAGKSDSSSVEDDIMSKLVTAQISIAEMDERMMKLRKELHKSVARNMYLVSKSSRMEKQLAEKRSK